MRRMIRCVTHAAYRHVVKPILFKYPPDSVHSGLLRVAKVVQKTPGIRRLPVLWTHQTSLLRQNVWGINFNNPVGLSAGFDKNIELMPLMQSIGFGFMTGGSVTAFACDGNKRPWFYRLPYSRSLVVHAGLPNAGITTIAKNIDGYSAKLIASMPLFVSVAKTNSQETVDDIAGIADYCASLRILEAQGKASVYEINISCPNVYGGEPFTSPLRLDKLLAAIDGLQLSRPVTLKMPINQPWDSFKKLLEVADRHNVQGLSIGNLQHSRSGVDSRDTLSSEIAGNLSGKLTEQASNELISRTYAAYGNRFIIIGIGGVFTAEDAYKKIRAGASLVGLITGMIFEGPQTVGMINAELEKLLARDGFAHVNDAVGADHSRG